MSKTVRFYYDFSSPNAYFAAVLLPQLAARRSARIEYKPFLLGGLFKTLGVHMTPGMSSTNKAAHTQRDLERWGRKHDIPFRFPSRFPMNTVKPLRIALALDAVPELRERFVLSIFRAYWVEDRDISDDAVLKDLLAGLGVDADALLARAEDPELKDKLRTATDEAVQAGVFGAPTFIVDGELFFGKDRLDFVEDALEGRVW